MASYGLYTHIASNKRRSVLLLVGLFFLIYVMVFAGALIAEATWHKNLPLNYLLQAAWVDLIKASPFATIGTAIWIAIAYRYHQSMIDAITGARDVTRKDEPRLYNLLENLCISRGITMPALKVMDSDALNAFATGLNDKQYSITVTSGLMQALNDEEIEAVLAHELTHIRNGDVRMMVIAVIIAGVVGFVAELFFRMFFNSGSSYSSSSSSSSSSSDRKSGGGAGPAIIIAVALIAISWLLSVMIRFALSRSREYLADAGSVELTKNPDAMIGALRKIENRGELNGATSAVMEMCVDNPRQGFADLFATHPSIDDRIQALIAYAGGHDPGPIDVLPRAGDGTQAPPSGETQHPTSGPWSDGSSGETPDAGVPGADGTPPESPPPRSGSANPAPLPPILPIPGTPDSQPPANGNGRRSPWGNIPNPWRR